MRAAGQPRVRAVWVQFERVAVAYDVIGLAGCRGWMLRGDGLRSRPVLAARRLGWCEGRGSGLTGRVVDEIAGAKRGAWMQPSAPHRSSSSRCCSCRLTRRATPALVSLGVKHQSPRMNAGRQERHVRSSSMQGRPTRGILTSPTTMISTVHVCVVMWDHLPAIQSGL